MIAGDPVGTFAAIGQGTNSRPEGPILIEGSSQRGFIGVPESIEIFQDKRGGSGRGGMQGFKDLR